MGNVLSAGLGQNPARQAALFGGLPATVAALTVNKVCGSGLKAVALAAQAVETGNARIVVAGGMESMSNAPYLLPQARQGFRLGNATAVDSMIHDGLWDVYNDYHMGITGENVAAKHRIAREEQDAFALQSHRKATAAWNEGRFDAEVVPVSVPSKKRGGPADLISRDESVRDDASLEALAALKPAFKKDGTVTAGNAPGVNDAAAALVVMSAATAASLGIPPLVRIVAQATSGVDPQWVMLAPVTGVQKVLARAGWTMDSVDLFELNEAFAVRADRRHTRTRPRYGPRQRQRRRSRHRSPDRCQRRAHPGHPDPRNDPPRRSPWRGRALPRRRQPSSIGSGKIKTAHPAFSM